MSNLYEGKKEVETIVKSIGSLTLNQIKDKFQITSYYDVFEWLGRFFCKYGKLTRTGMSLYLGVDKKYANNLFGKKGMQIKEFSLADRSIKYVEITEFWRWVGQNYKYINLSLVKEELIEQQSEFIKKLYQESRLVRKKNANWSEGEIKFLEEKWGDMTLQYIAYSLGRTIDSVRVKAAQLGMGSVIKNEGQLLTCKELARELGYVADVTKAWEDKNELPVIRKRLHRRKGNAVRYVDVSEFWLWLAKHTAIVDLKKARVEKLEPVPNWFYRERDRQMQSQKEQEWLCREWTQLDKLKLLKLRHHEEVGFIRISKALNRNINNVKKTYRELETKPNYRLLLEQAAELDLERYGIHFKKRTRAFTDDEKRLLLYLAELPGFNLPAAAEVLNVPYSSLRARYKELLKSVECAQLKEGMRGNDYSRYDHIFDAYESKVQKRKWKDSEDELLIYLVEFEKKDWTKVSVELDRTIRTVQRRYNKLKSKV